MAAALTDEQYRRDTGAYFKSLHRTLNHLLVADRIWLRRLTGTGDAPARLDAVLFDDLAALATARQQEDGRLSAFVNGLSEAQCDELWEYRNLSGAPQRERCREILAHLFNHQTHHRGQAHVILSTLGLSEPEPLDLIIMVRERSAAAPAPRPT
jgi:uncharacterized damage-inducible protein DinB